MIGFYHIEDGMSVYYNQLAKLDFQIGKPNPQSHTSLSQRNALNITQDSKSIRQKEKHF